MRQQKLESVVQLEKMIENDELQHFISGVKDLLDYENLKNESKEKRIEVLNQLLIKVQKYRSKNNDYKLKYIEGFIYYRLNDFLNAEQIFNELISNKVRTFNVYYYLGCVYLEKEEYTKASKSFFEASKINSKSGLVYFKLAQAYERSGKIQLAIENYKKCIDFSSDFGWAYYNLAELFIKLEEYDQAKKYLNDVLSLKLDDYEYMYQLIEKDLIEIDKRVINQEYEKVSQIIDSIKDVLHTDTYNIIHYTSLSVARELVLNNSELRLSEATFLNDTSEGKTLLDYLEIFKNNDANQKSSYEFINKPYIGSFVKPELYNDLSLWRMYGKEGKEEAEGCSLLIDGAKFIEVFRNSLMEGKEEWINVIDKEFKFYRVAYLGLNSCFCGDSKIDKKLNKLLLELKQSVTNIDLNKDVLKRISEVAYLFKAIEYKYENETRLVLSNPFISNEFIDKDFTPNKVYVKLAPITSSLLKLTIGPKVKLADEWAASFYYSLKKMGLSPKIEISTLPFK